jgi:serine/threonine-protein kinase
VLPKRIGRYEVLGQLAAGGMAEILLARLSGPADFQRAVVIKRILRSYAANESFVRMFLDEARIVASLRHPNVVHVQELGEHEGDPFLVMEYVAGENLSSLLKRSVASGEALDPRLAAHVVADACAGLHAAHELASDDGRPQNLVHRDVSPQNVLVGYDGHVKLVDFGVALVEQRSTRTEPGEVKGKFDYMSPEQMLGQPLDRRSDVFSLGIVLYELSTGRRLFKRASHAKTIEAICREPVVPPSRVITPGGPPYPPRLEAIVMRALAKEKDGRYASAAEMRKDLLEVARDLASPTDALAERMRRLFPDRIAEKDEMLRRVGAGDELSHVPPGETDEAVEVPNAPEPTIIDPRDPRPPPEAARRWRLAAIAAASVAIALAAVAAIASRRAAPPAPATAAAASATDPVVAPPGPPPAEVSVHVETKPTGARVVVGGTDRGETPLDLRLPRGSGPVSIEVRRQGYVTIAQPITPDADQKVLVALTPVPVRGRPAARPSKTVSGAPTGAAPPARPPAAPTSTAGAPGFRRFD